MNYGPSLHKPSKKTQTHIRKLSLSKSQTTTAYGSKQKTRGEEVLNSASSASISMSKYALSTSRRCVLTDSTRGDRPDALSYIQEFITTTSLCLSQTRHSRMQRCLQS